MNYTIEISHTFEGMITPALEDATAHTTTEHVGPPDEYLIRLVLVAQALGQGSTRKTGIVVELDEVGIEVLREEAVYRMESANDIAAFEFGIGDRMKWFGMAHSAKAMINRIDKVTA